MKHNRVKIMPAYINAIATALPEHVYPQAFAREMMKTFIGGKRETTAILHRVYTQSGIDRRYSVLPDFEEGATDGMLFLKNGEFHLTPSTGERNKIYSEQAKILFSSVARQAIANAGLAPDEITHVITVSCTGFFAPGPDYSVVMDLGLPLSTPRFHLGFMGCYAFFPALRMARSFCESDPNAKVLIICVELCTLHLQLDDSVDSILSGSVFGDGASAAIVTANPSKTTASMKVETMQTMLAPEGEADMAWTIGDNGFEMVLTSYVPTILEMKTDATIKPMLQQAGFSKEDIHTWAVHPGGRAIIDKVKGSMDLDESMLWASREVLFEVGNLSSATILFVLDKILRKSPKNGDNVVAMAFGPGLTIESAVLSMTNPTS
jgi:predicted naringenin-chalcone synthase